MTANPFQIMRILDYRGAQIRLDDRRLVGRMVDGGPMPDDLVRFIRHFRDQIITHLGRAGAPPPPARPGPPIDPGPLLARLDRGWALCEGEPDPNRRARLEDHFIALLHEYEAGCDAVAPPAPHSDTRRVA